MSVGVLAGAGAYGLFDLIVRASGGTIASSNALLDLLLIGLLAFVPRSIAAYREELGDANPAGRLLSLFTILLVAAAAFFSLVLLF
jgi:hypothetical protein